MRLMKECRTVQPGVKETPARAAAAASSRRRRADARLELIENQLRHNPELPRDRVDAPIAGDHGPAREECVGRLPRELRRHGIRIRHAFDPLALCHNVT